MKVAIVCIAKDENYYLQEWISYNLKLGFDHIFLYQNDWRTDIENPQLTKLIWDGPVAQLPAYNNFLNTNKDYDWIAFIDCDEYISLKKHDNIKDFIKEYDNPNGIGLNWFFYGSGGQLNRVNNSLLHQFKYRSNNVDQHVKTILNVKSGARMQLPHNPNIPIMDTNNKFFAGPFNPHGPTDVAYINHYHNKTKEDWEIRIKRGRVDAPIGHDYTVWDREINMNIDVEDVHALNFYLNN